jgi:segregation and condensation protein A
VSIQSIVCERMSAFKVQFEMFEGPLDLLLYLTRKQEVDIYNVDLSQLTQDFLEFLETMRLLDLDVAGEFLIMAATLLLIKSKELLPVDLQVDEIEEEEGEDPRWELIRRLIEYRKFKDVSGELKQRELEQDWIYRKTPGKLEFDPIPEGSRQEVDVFVLVEAMNGMLQRFREREQSNTREIVEDQWSVSDKIQFLYRRILRDGEAKFESLFEDAQSRQEIVVTFLAMLELSRLRYIQIVQPELFGPILIVKNTGEDAPLVPPSFVEEIPEISDSSEESQTAE